jgi:hypothetical protein
MPVTKQALEETIRPLEPINRRFLGTSRKILGLELKGKGLRKQSGADDWYVSFVPLREARRGTTLKMKALLKLAVCHVQKKIL